MAYQTKLYQHFHREQSRECSRLSHFASYRAACVYCRCSLVAFTATISALPCANSGTIQSYSLGVTCYSCDSCKNSYCFKCWDAEQKQCVECTLEEDMSIRAVSIIPLGSSKIFKEYQRDCYTKTGPNPYLGDSISPLNVPINIQKESTDLSVVDPDAFRIKETFSLSRDRLLHMCQYRSCDIDQRCQSLSGMEHKDSAETFKTDNLFQSTKERRVLIASDGFFESKLIHHLNYTSAYLENSKRAKAIRDYKKSVKQHSNDKVNNGARWFALVDQTMVQSFVHSVPVYIRHFYICPDPHLPVDLVIDFDKEFSFGITDNEKDVDVAFMSLLGIDFDKLQGQYENELVRNADEPHPAALYAIFKVFVAIQASFQLFFDDQIGTAVLLNGCRVKKGNKQSIYKVSFHLHIRPLKQPHAFFSNMNELDKYIYLLKSYPEILRNAVADTLNDIFFAKNIEGHEMTDIAQYVISENDLMHIDIAIYRPWQPIRLPHCSKRDDNKIRTTINCPDKEDALRFYPPIRSYNESRNAMLKTLFRPWKNSLNSLSESACFDRCLVTHSTRFPSEDGGDYKALSLSKMIVPNSFFPHPTGDFSFQRPNKSSHMPRLEATVRDPMLQTPYMKEKVKIWNTSIVYDLITQRLKLFHENFVDVAKASKMNLCVPENDVPHIYVRMVNARYCMQLKRYHGTTQAQCKLYIGDENITMIKSLNRSYRKDDVGIGFDVLGVKSIGFVCFSNDCQGKERMFGPLGQVDP